MEYILEEVGVAPGLTALLKSGGVSVVDFQKEGMQGRPKCNGRLPQPAHSQHRNRFHMPTASNWLVLVAHS